MTRDDPFIYQQYRVSDWNNTFAWGATTSAPIARALPANVAQSRLGDLFWNCHDARIATQASAPSQSGDRTTRSRTAHLWKRQRSRPLRERTACRHQTQRRRLRHYEA